MQPRLFQLGTDHLLLNGDSTDVNHLAILHSAAKELGIDKAEICLTDPPYGVNMTKDLHRKIGRPGIYTYPFRQTAIAGDNLDSTRLYILYEQCFNHVKSMFSCWRSMIFYSGSNASTIHRLADNLQYPRRSVLIWVKNQPVISFAEFCPQTEFILYCGKTSAIKRNKNRTQGNIFVCRQGRIKKETPWYHPTTKPIKLLRDLLDATTIVGDVIIDPFAGTGSSLVAAHRTGRKWLGVELDSKYCIATLMRYRYETAKQSPVYEIIDGQRVELSDSDLEAEIKQYQTQQGA